MLAVSFRRVLADYWHIQINALDHRFAKRIPGAQPARVQDFDARKIEELKRSIGPSGGNGSFAGTISSFGAGGAASGTFSGCTGGLGSFAGCDNSFSNGGLASGAFNGCIGGNGSFAGTTSALGFGGTASDTFNGCKGGTSSFVGFAIGSSGGPGTAAGGKFIYCNGGANSFTTAGSPITLYCAKNNAVYP